ncbi:MAG TPA: glycosyltransferase [Pyrinomonadaceae bacterium]|nr:glycosyltransferase [Pyrinomonadaceae bacterium]
MRRNILELIPSFHQGGSERQAVQLTRLLCERGRYNVFVATLDAGGPLRGDIESLGIDEPPEYRLTSFYDRNFVAQLRRFARHLRERRIDVVHAHDFYTNIFGMAAASLARVPARIASRRESSVRPPKQKLVEHGAFRLSHAVVANCEEIRRQLLKEGVGAAKAVTLYNGLDMTRVTPAAELQREDVLAALNLPPGRRRFVTIVANLRPHFWNPKPVSLKDHPTFLRAARRVREAVPEAAFVIAGEGELLGETQALAAQLGIAEDTFFVGRCSRVADLLAISDVCVLSSQSEGFSNSILEYMAAARPVVVTDVGGAREAVAEGETGYLVRAGDDELMAARIISLLREPERAREMGARGRQVVVEKFSCEAQFEGARSLYDRLLGSGSPVARPGAERVRVGEGVLGEKR